MKNVNSDSKFFTNKEGQTLLERFKEILPKNTKYFDILVGYFRASGFLEIYEYLESIEKIRILVGINIDKATYQLIESSQDLLDKSFSSEEARENYLNCAIREINSQDDKKVEKGVRKFIEFIESGKVEIKVYPKSPIHAKIYIVRKDPQKVEDFGKVITGSSNFSHSGLEGNLEFNVELKDSQDVKFALEHFEKLWNESVDITQDYVTAIREKTWLKDDILPYELYLKFLYEYFGPERIGLDKKPIQDVPEDFLKLQYQSDAVEEIIEKVEKYGGAYLADVVGLGKTYISAMIAKVAKGPFMVICPPKLIDYWHDIFFDFGVPVGIFSNGDLKNVLKKNLDRYEYVVIDEAHKFRNEKTHQYEMLERIVVGKKIILVSATPLNNEPMDIGSQIFLFQDKYRSDLPGLRNLRYFFKHLQTKINKINRKKDPQKYIEAVRESAELIRLKVLKQLMVRRTRKEVEDNYTEDLKKRGVSFPKIVPPNQMFYKFNRLENEVFEKTLEAIKQLTYSRYLPLTYLKTDIVDSSELIGQYNLKSFMKGLLIKRLDSSFSAFKQTLARFIKSYENFIRMYERGSVFISKEINVFELMENDDEGVILSKFEEQLEKGKKGKKYKSKDFRPGFKQDLQKDKKLLEGLERNWEDIKHDPKLEKFIFELRNNKILKDKEKKIIVFTESKDSAEYLENELKEVLEEKTIKAVHGSSPKEYFRRIRRNFDPNIKKENQEDEIRLLIATDALSEGINLHRANIIVNYDIPWNSTKVLQRVGRVNRIGQHEKIHIFNFFPVEEAEEQIGLKQKAVAKLQAFYDALGEDAQYLTKEEEFASQGLFEKVNSADFLGGEEIIASSELPYLNEIRKVRDKNFAFYQKIKKLPARTRSAKSHASKINELLTYFKIGEVDKIYITSEEEELDFQSAEQDLKHGLPSQGNIPVVLEQIETLIRSDLWTNEERNYLQDVKLAIEIGINDQTIKNLKQGLEKAKNEKEKFEVIKKNIDKGLVEKKIAKENTRKEQRKHQRVILSEYFTD